MPRCRLMLLVATALAALLPCRVTHAGDAAAGATVFAAQCAACHAVTAAGPARVGPTLAGIVGRRAGSVPGFRYSPASQKAALVFDEATLDRYLMNPRAIIPGTVMAYPGLKDPARRRELIAFLAQQN